jgi:formylglycine-generating enzyme required for sulfatase activity
MGISAQTQANPPNRRNIPSVFISSTVEDLKPYRTAAEFEAARAGFQVLGQEYFVASGDKRPLEKCLQEVAKADLVVVIIAHRYGWVPPGQPGANAMSITWLECEEALREGDGKKRIEVHAFLVEKDSDSFKWPLHLRESYRAMAATEEGEATPELHAEIQRNVKKLREFKQWLSSLVIYATFTDVGSLRAEVVAALEAWRRRHPEFAESPATVGHCDPTKYLESLREQTGWIDIRGLMVGSGKASRFPIDELYIPLTTASGLRFAGERLGIERGGSSRRLPRGTVKEDASAARSERVELEDLLTHRRLVIVGDPGAGKTTFLYRIAFELSDGWLKTEGATLGILGPAPSGAAKRGSEAGASFLDRLGSALRQPFAGEADGGTRAARTVKHSEVARDGEPLLPIFVRIAELAEHIRGRRGQPGYKGPTTEDNPAWLLDFLKDQSTCNKWGLDGEFFEQKLESGSAILLLDGLDEPSATIEREAMARLFEKATHAYERCRFVVTTRPLAYVGKAVLAGFKEARIEPLEPELIENFLGHWCRALFPESEEKARRHLRELAEALRSTVEIRRMARNPVMLTALAVVHWNERRLPEQRADLYSSILTWLARSREKRPGREPAERCLTLLECLALAMQDRSQGRLVQIWKSEAADVLAARFRGGGKGESHRMAEDFISQEEVDSGIIVSRGSSIRFWHLIFQEYLAARAIAGLVDTDQDKLLLTGNKLYLPEWREVVLLLAGVLVESGTPRVDRLVTEMLNRLGERASLAERARCVGLLGAMLQDLRPVGYEPADARYDEALKSVLGIFDKVKSKQVDFRVRLEAAEALGQAGDPRLQQNNWIPIPAGTFFMGAQREGVSKPNFDDEAERDWWPVHEVYLDAFMIGRFPVTVGQFGRFVDDEGYSNLEWWRAGGFGQNQAPYGWDEQILHPSRPVVGVSFYEAEAYCAWARVQLPTEAEWERAARGTTGRKFPWGNEEPDSTRANHADGGIGHPTPIGLYPTGATPEGIEDLAGNVWEWVADRFGSYAKWPSPSPRGPASGGQRVLRGGSWNDNPTSLRAAYRGRFEPEKRSDSLGFRCVREALP